ncbi:cob(I)yrinic acid a,c-diamide adenosyltransferase [Halodesulfurarchaeum sp. HSR-GB]|uniref:cob(I)yrinic acid a,c-diamide adenosyltransferase n=1 Tax=Halodesulfurarchaeum sp. HSR-GB TaxID=3074077 RepID=UPI0028551434|nr:cob(I)yrinic acid a,c-diamide adenosyltransferase [Halodesulfurarchaeum sp. HSR-GB]MDR5656599.1 cob(I)yrinic acid a,c-diamide adenosyltransferase [Halodesulfurarchaeum sp. HSR-GB]
MSQSDSDGEALTAKPIEPSAPEEFGLVQVWWGDGKGKTTAAMGMGMRAAGHGYRVHLLQFMKGGTQSVEDIRGEYNAIAALPGYTYENLGHYGWHHGQLNDDEHAAKAQAGLKRANEIIDGAADADLSTPFDPESDPESGVHMLILDELIYAANRELLSGEAVIELIENKPDSLELVLTGGHESPEYLSEHADLISNVSLVKHPFDEGTTGRKGTEF